MQASAVRKGCDHRERRVSIARFRRTLGTAAHGGSGRSYTTPRGRPLVPSSNQKHYRPSPIFGRNGFDPEKKLVHIVPGYVAEVVDAGHGPDAALIRREVPDEAGQIQPDVPTTKRPAKKTVAPHQEEQRGKTQISLTIDPALLPQLDVLAGTLGLSRAGTFSLAVSRLLAVEKKR
jgi:hypothetical protein